MLLESLRAAPSVANETDLSGAKALSDAALDVLPRINPYAEKFYETEEPGSQSFKNNRDLLKLASEYRRCASSLREIMEKCKVNTRLPNKELEEDKDVLLSIQNPKELLSRSVVNDGPVRCNSIVECSCGYTAKYQSLR